MEQYGIIYKITCLVDPKAYIGKTKKTLGTRWSTHLSDFKRFLSYEHTPGTKKRNFCTFLYNGFDKYGVHNFTINMIGSALSKEELSQLETQMIAEHGTLAPNGYNLTTGGEGGWEHPPELKEKMRENTIKGIHANIDKLRKNALSKGLPVHVIFTKLKGDKDAYLIQHHPLCNQKEFKVDDYVTIEATREACVKFLNDLEKSGIPYKPPKEGNNIPRGMRKLEDGYQVKKMRKGVRYIQDFRDPMKSDARNFEDACRYLESLVIKLNFEAAGMQFNEQMVVVVLDSLDSPMSADE